MVACYQGCIHSADSVKKHFLNGSKQNETGMTYQNLSNRNLFATETNDFTIDQLDAGKSVEGGMCHLDYSNFSLPVHLRCKLLFIG